MARPERLRAYLLLAAMMSLGMLLAGRAFSQPLVTAASGAHGFSESRWSLSVSLGGRGAAPRAADRSAGGDLAVADEAGVTWWRGKVRERAQIDDVRDVAFDSVGQLWIGAGSGLYAWILPGRPVRRALRGGESANRIRRLAVQGRSMLVASEQGAFWSTSGRIFQPLEGVAANDDYSLAAFRTNALRGNTGVESVPRVEVWLFGRRGLVRIHGMETASGLRVVRMDRSALPRPTRESSAMDLSVSADGRTLWAAYPDALAARVISFSDERREQAEPWVWLRPVLPPGAEIRRFVAGTDRMLLASDHGLLEAESQERVFRRVASSAGTSSCVDVREANSVAIALCREGVFENGAGSVRGAHVSGLAASPYLPVPTAFIADHALPLDPPLSEIRRRAIKRSGLSVSRTDSMRRGLARRAFLPEVAIRFGVDVDRDRARDADQAFVSGEKRFLLDQSRDEGLGLDASIALKWDLGGVAFPDDTVDLSRELRQVVSLRDDIADEINQLYFERQRIRARLRQAAPQTQEEVSALYWRAREIDAGLDAWTGGWIADWRHAQRSREAANQNDHPVQERGKRQ